MHFLFLFLFLRLDSGQMIKKKHGSGSLTLIIHGINVYEVKCILIFFETLHGCVAYSARYC